MCQTMVRHNIKKLKTLFDALQKRGRKYGLGLGLISQRPSDVESTVLSQCNSWIVLRLSNSSDQEHVSRFLPDSLSGLTKMLSALTRREAIFVGEAAALPSRLEFENYQLESYLILTILNSQVDGRMMRPKKLI